MKIISWNVNGLRACVTKGFIDFFNEVQADIFCVQETKLQTGQIELELEGYHQYWNYADKKGYSGTAIFTKEEPLQVMYGMGIDEHDHEGRLITLEFEKFYLINGYIPNAQSELKRIDYRMKWEDDFRNYICGLDQDKPVIFCGDLNVAHQEIDLKNPKNNRGNAGFSDEERGKFTELLAAGFVDTFRYFHPELEGASSCLDSFECSLFASFLYESAISSTETFSSAFFIKSSSFNVISCVDEIAVESTA